MTTNPFDALAAAWDDHPQRVRLTRAVADTIRREVPLTADMTVLDYGGGTGLLGLCLLPDVGQVVCADNSPGMLRVLRDKTMRHGIDNLHAMELDLQRDPVPAQPVDVITVSMALHHIPDVDRVLRAFGEMLAPGGWVCLADLDREPGTFHDAAVADTVYHHGFDRGDLARRLTEAGLPATDHVTVAEFDKPVASGQMERFSIFLMTARRESDRPSPAVGETSPPPE